MDEITGRAGGLTLERRDGERVLIDFEGERVDVMVTRLSASKVFLHFIAPRSVKILRAELDGTPSKVQVPT